MNDGSQVGEARRGVANLAENEGFEEDELGKISIVVTELANNLLRHAGGGQLLVRADKKEIHQL